MIYNAEEIFDIGIEIEKSGKKFYTAAASLAEDEDLKKFFKELADWEDTHVELFVKLKADIAKDTTATMEGEGYTDEAERYLKAAADSHIFKRNLDIPAMVKGCESPLDVLKLALQFEKDSVVLYNTMMDMVPEDLGQTHITALINEELKHVAIIQEQIAIY